METRALTGTMASLYLNSSQVKMGWRSMVPIHHLYDSGYSLVETPHKGPDMRKAFPCHDVALQS